MGSTTDTELTDFSVDTGSGFGVENIYLPSLPENVSIVEKIDVFDDPSEINEKEEITTLELNSTSIETSEPSSTTKLLQDESVSDDDSETPLATTNIPDQDFTEKSDNEFSNELD